MSVSPIHTRIWHEEPEPDNPFAARRARCHGYDVHGALVGRAGWADMVFLLFRGEAPMPAQRALLDALAVALANPGPRDPSVHAAMCGGVGGSTAAASLSAALAVGAGQCGGAREVFLVMGDWADCATDIAAWRQRLRQRQTQPIGESDDVWPVLEHLPGFDPHGSGTRTPGTVRDMLAALAAVSPGPRLPWLHVQRAALEDIAGMPIAATFVAAAAWADLGMDPAEGEMLHLLCRLPGAAAHALEQGRHYGFKRFPFPPVTLLDDPAAKEPA